MPSISIKVFYTFAVHIASWKKKRNTGNLFRSGGNSHNAEFCICCGIKQCNKLQI